MALVLGGLIVATALLEAVGFRLAMLALLPLPAPRPGRAQLVRAGRLLLAGSFGIYHVFSDLLKVPLP